MSKCGKPLSARRLRKSVSASPPRAGRSGARVEEVRLDKVGLGGAGTGQFRYQPKQPPFVAPKSYAAVREATVRDVRGVLIPVGTAVLSAIWGIGLLGLLGYNFDPLILVVPFIISAG